MGVFVLDLGVGRKANSDWKEEWCYNRPSNFHSSLGETIERSDQ